MIILKRVGLDVNAQIVGDRTSRSAVIPSVDMLFGRFLEKHVDGRSSSGCIIYLIDFLQRGGFSQTYTLIRDLSRAVQNNFTVPFVFYYKLKRSQTDQHPHHTSLTELLIRVYHRTIHTRGQRERHQDILLHMLEHITLFCLHVQATSALIGLESGDGNG